jgi:hypothetical protein
VKKGLVFLIFGLCVGLFWPSICNAKNQVQVTATVLEHITYIRLDKKIKVLTNTTFGYWEISDDKYTIIVSQF